MGHMGSSKRWTTFASRRPFHYGPVQLVLLTFFEKAHGTARTLNLQRYRPMLSNYFWRKIEDYNLEVLWFQQDGATGSKTLSHRDLLQENFAWHVMPRFSDVNWSARSCDLTPLDYFCGPTESQHSWCGFRDVGGNVSQIIENFLKRSEDYKLSSRGHLSDIVWNL